MRWLTAYGLLRRRASDAGSKRIEPISERGVEVSSGAKIRLTAWIAGFLLPWQTVWILRPGMLGGVSWPLATIGLYASDVVLLVAAVVGVARLLRSTSPSSPSEGVGKTKKISSLPPQWRGAPARLWRERGRWWGSHRRLLVASALLIVVAVVNTFVSADSWLSAVGWARLIALLLAFMGLPYARETTRAFLTGFLVAMLGHVALGFWQFATGHGFASTLLGTAAHDAFVRGDSVLETLDGRWLRAYGGFPHPNVFGVALLAGMISIIVISTGAKRNGEISGRSEISRLHFISLEMTMWVVFVFSLMLTFSRAAWIGFALLLFVLARRRAMRSIAVAGAVAAIAMGIVFAPLVAPRVTGDGRNESRSITERRSGIRDALALSVIPPFLGAGLHAMPQAIAQQSSRARARDPVRNPLRDPYTMQPVHTVPLLALVEVGVAGVLILVFVLVLVHIRQLFPLPSYLLPFLPAFLLDHSLWSLPIGLALVFIFVMSASLDSVRSPE